MVTQAERREIREAVRAELLAERKGLRRWARYGLVAACIALPLVASAFDPFEPFTAGDAIAADEMNSRFDAIAGAIDGLESSAVTTDASGRVSIGTPTSGSTLNVGASGDGAEVLRLEIDRPWCFGQEGTDQNTKLKLATCDLNAPKWLVLEGAGVELRGALSVTGLVNGRFQFTSEGYFTQMRVVTGEPGGDTRLYLRDESGVDSVAFHANEVIATALAGTGNAYACVAANGQLYRSASACN